MGVTGLDISRADFYEKELSFQVSCSYGPGRYDSNYESKGIDYPLAFVRWTEQRNFSAILDAISSGKLKVAPLVTEKIILTDYKKIYEGIGQSKSIALNTSGVICLNIESPLEFKNFCTRGDAPSYIRYRFQLNVLNDFPFFIYIISSLFLVFYHQSLNHFHICYYLMM